MTTPPPPPPPPPPPTPTYPVKARGYVLDGFGGLHGFSTPTSSAPPTVTSGSYWQGWDIARGVDTPDGWTGILARYAEKVAA